MLFKLSIKNIRKSIKDYVIYFFTLIAGVAIFYVFNAIESQTVMLKVSESAKEIIDLMVEMLSGVSVFVSMILGFLIIYASRFLIKRRNKEFGIYLTLGMGKRKISLILFFETLLIGILSLAVGILAGVGVSQFMSAFVANMFEADLTKFEFVFSESACKKTMLYFGIMYLVVMVFNTVSVSRCKLIDLLHGAKKTEQIKMKNPFLCVVVFLVAAGVLAKAYYMVTAGYKDLQFMHTLLVPIGMGIVGTFLVFWSLSGLMLRIFMSRKKTYYKGLNCFTLRQVSSQINTMVGSISIICIMLFVTIGVMSTCFSIKNSMDTQLDELAPVDIEILKYMNIDEWGQDDGYSAEEMEAGKWSIEEAYKLAGIDILSELSEYERVGLYFAMDYTLQTFLGDLIDKIADNYPFIDYNKVELFMCLSDYNRLAKMYGKETLTLNEDEYIVVANFQSMVDIWNYALEQGQTVEIFGRTLKPKYKACQDGYLHIAGSHIETGFFVVPDSVTEHVNIRGEILVGNYKVTSKEEKRNLENRIMSARRRDELKYCILNINTRLDICDATIGLGAMVTFIGLYLGVIFLISSAAILALKQLSESADNRERYQRLRQLGADEGMIKKALFSQIGIFFLAPLLLALVHSIFGIKFSLIMLETMGMSGMLAGILLTVGILLAIYGGYFVLTYVCSKGIIRENYRY